MGYLVAALCGVMSALVIKNEQIDVSHKIFLLLGIIVMYSINIFMSKPSQTKESQ